MIKIVYLTAYIFLVLHVQKISCNNDSTNVILYDGENGTGNSVSFRKGKNPAPWNNVMDLLTRAGLSGVQSICVETGVFILYQDPDYKTQNDDGVRLISGIKQCTSPPPAGIGSVRHASNKLTPFTNSTYVTLYSEEYYGGISPHSVVSKSSKKIASSQPTRSMIMVGSDRWLFETITGDKLCVVPAQPKDPDGIYVCIVPNAANIFDTGNGLADSNFEKVGKGCKTPGVRQVNVTTCFDYKSGELQKPAVPEIDAIKTTTTTTEKPTDPVKPKPNATDNGDGSSPFFGKECNTFDEIALLIRLRVTNDFLDTYQFLLPFDKEHIWRTELLDSTFEVMSKLLGTIVPPWFIGSVREFFIYFIEKEVWKVGNGLPENATTRDIAEVLYETRQCFKLAADWDMLEKIQETVNGIIQTGVVIKPELVMMESKDPLTEFVWLGVNIVAATCHHILGFETNFWLDYATVATEMYLMPMAEFWRFGKEYEQKYYPIIFGGVNFAKQYQRAAVFASTVYDLMKYSVVWERPKEVMSDASMGQARRKRI